MCDSRKNEGTDEYDLSLYVLSSNIDFSWITCENDERDACLFDLVVEQHPIVSVLLVGVSLLSLVSFASFFR